MTENFPVTFRNELRGDTAVNSLPSFCLRVATSSVFLWICLFVGCLTSQQHASVPHGRICSDSLTCCHTEKEVAHPAFHLTPSQYTDTGPTSPRADPITPGGVATGVPVFKSLVGLDPGKISAQAGFEPGIFRFRAAFNLHHLGG